MSLEALDARLAEWAERLQRVDDNLIALEGEPAFQMLAAAKKRLALAGRTRDQAGPALDAVAELFAARQRLGDLLDRARAARADIGFIGRDEKTRKVFELLDGASIPLGRSEVPLARRSLLGESGRDLAVTPEALLTQMVTSFEAARDVVTRAGQAWEMMTPVLTEATARVAEMRQKARADGGAAADLAAFDAELSSLAERAANDPLGVLGSLAMVRSTLDELDARLAAERAVHDACAAALGEARALCEAVAARHQEARRSLLATESAVTPPSSMPLVDDALIDGLSDWLEKLTRAFDAGRLGAARVGLDRFREAGRGYLEADQRAVSEARARLALRDELLGRTAARTAQLRALRARGAFVPADLDERLRAADALLHQRPTPIDEARLVVDAIDLAVAALHGRG